MASKQAIYPFTFLPDAGGAHGQYRIFWRPGGRLPR